MQNSIVNAVAKLVQTYDSAIKDINKFNEIRERNLEDFAERIMHKLYPFFAEFKSGDERIEVELKNHKFYVYFNGPFLFAITVYKRSENIAVVVDGNQVVTYHGDAEINDKFVDNCATIIKNKVLNLFGEYLVKDAEKRC